MHLFGNSSPRIFRRRRRIVNAFARMRGRRRESEILFIDGRLRFISGDGSIDTDARGSSNNEHTVSET